ncbi:M48 family metalloprotease [Candidatus Albibeggiatoa sp. nov. NOAA]|uniref:M48 family metalloprotease n=1 Tax=Candidatus Albibeggiatoa sp. nov. NOAA TaxID=3162724 RepID=UPI0032FED433|nr:M48 family metalloprotease [Thiotrichaceae bacterium]
MRLLLLFFCFLFSFPIFAKDNVQFYLEKYGRANPQNAYVQQAEIVFKRIVAVADRKHHRYPQLAIINSPADPWAIALPDGYIVIASKTLEICYKNVSKEVGDTRVAFILGHELAHLANDDFWHQEVAQFSHQNQALSQALQHRPQQKELAADDRGFIYAAIAGYPVDKLLTQDFFQHWQQQTTTQIHSETHPDPQIRQQMLQARLKNILDKLPLFHFGVRLSHFERCEDAVYFLREFQKIFPAREVLNNLGFCYLQLARQDLGQAAYYYWMPLLLDTHSQADTLDLAPRSAVRSDLPSRRADKWLLQAKDYLELAVKTDKYYVPAHLNLAVTLLYLKEIYHARAVIEKARKLEPDNLMIQGLRALILYEEGLETDMWSQAIQLLQKLIADENVPTSLIYNAARLLDIRGRSGSDALWQRLAQQHETLPPAIRMIVCEKTDCPRPTTAPSTIKQWQPPIEVGTYIRRNKTAKQVLKKWRSLPFDWQLELYGTVYQAPQQGYELLEIAGYLEMAVFNQVSDLNPLILQDYCAAPLQKRQIAQGELYFCQNWAALVLNQHVKQVWLVKN